MVLTIKNWREFEEKQILKTTFFEVDNQIRDLGNSLL